MPLPDTEIERAKNLLDVLCSEKSIGSAKVGYQIRGNKVSLTESRPLFIDPTIVNTIHVAQFEFVPGQNIWVLYWYDRRDKRVPYPTGRNRDELEKLVHEVRTDPTGVFWE